MSESDQHGQGGERLRRTAAEAQAEAGERLHEAQARAREMADQAARRAEAEAERGKNRGAGEIHSWASALERAANELGADSAQGRAIRRASAQLDEVARSIETQSAGDMVRRLADFGRRNPAAFAGGAMLAGFALSRFATASRPAPEPEHEEDRR